MHADGSRLDEEADREQGKHHTGAFAGGQQRGERLASRHGMGYRKSGKQEISGGKREDQIAEGVRNCLAPPRDQEIRGEGY